MYTQLTLIFLQVPLAGGQYSRTTTTYENWPPAFGITAWAILVYIVLRVWWEVKHTGSHPDPHHWPYVE